MRPNDAAGSAPPRGSDRAFPAYGPVDAMLGYGLFVVVVERATPTVTTVFADVVSVSPALVGLGTAALLWFVFLVTAVEQCRRQLVALGVVGTPSDEAETPALSGRRALGYLALAVGGGAVAAATADDALDATVGLIRAVSVVDAGAIGLGDVLLVAVFFVAFGLVTRALDRLVIGGLRAVLTDGTAQSRAENQP